MKNWPNTSRTPGKGAQPLALTLMGGAVVAGTVLMAGCGGGTGAGQTAAKVNRDELTVEQVDFVLQQHRGLKPEQAEATGRQVLERLIDQQLALQQAGDLKLDRDPRVLQQLDAARREILARAYAEKVGATATPPTPAEVKRYYDEKPALFRERRVYSIQEIAIEAEPGQVAELRERLAASANIGEFVDYLKARQLRFTGNQAVRAAEQLPLNSLETLARMRDGQALIVPSNGGVQVVVLAGSRSQPVSEEQARPAIEQFLLNERKRKQVEEDQKALRAAARIDYVGKFAPQAASAAGRAASGTGAGQGLR